MIQLGAEAARADRWRGLNQTPARRVSDTKRRNPMPTRVTLLTPAQLAEAFALNVHTIFKQTAGVTHAESLRATPFPLNWVLGHILVNRDRALALLGEAPRLREAERAWYVSEPPQFDPGQAVRFDHQLRLLEHGQPDLAKGLVHLSPKDWTREVMVGERKLTLAARLFGLYVHDTYHTGQAEILRQQIAAPLIL
jgi:hypothetical protein